MLKLALRIVVPYFRMDWVRGKILFLGRFLFLGRNLSCLGFGGTAYLILLVGRLEVVGSYWN